MQLSSRRTGLLCSVRLSFYPRHMRAGPASSLVLITLFFSPPRRFRLKPGPSDLPCTQLSIEVYRLLSNEDDITIHTPLLAVVETDGHKNLPGCVQKRAAN
jgi:hypothetical protein